MPFREIVRLNARRGIARRLPLGCVAALLGCPQLLDDQFETLSASQLDGGVVCTGVRCESIDPPGPPDPWDGDAGVDGPDEPPVDASVDASEPPVEPVHDDAGSEPQPVTPPACWTLELTEAASVSDASCLELSGWNDVETSSSDVELDFRNGDACFEGSVTSGGWAVYNMELAASGGTWDASSHGVGGFAFDMSGELFPPSLQIKYFDGSDFCSPIPVGGSAELRFSETHPDCASTGGVPNASALRMLRVVFPSPSSGSSYSVDFCIQLRALPAD